MKQSLIIYAILVTGGMTVLNLKLIISAWTNNGIAVINFNAYGEMGLEYYLVMPLITMSTFILMGYVFYKEVVQ